MADKRYKVAGQYVTLKVRDQVTGAKVIRGFYAGAYVPDSVDEASLAHHLAEGLVVEDGTPEAEVFAVPAGTPIPGEPPNVDVTEETPAPRAHVDRMRSAVEATERTARDAKRATPPKDEPADKPASRAGSK